jgi:hypothetical protein
MKPVVALVASWLWVAGAQAQAPTPQARGEIEALFERLAGSSCTFERNGRWYEPVRARQHLQRKYDYLLARDLVPDAETFIARAASESSFSGKPYRVRCAGREPEPSRDWFLRQLEVLRRDRAAAG